MTAELWKFLQQFLSEIESKMNLHRIWIKLEKPFVKWPIGELSLTGINKPLQWFGGTDIILNGGDIKYVSVHWELCNCHLCPNYLTHLPLDKMAAILADDNLKCIFLNESDKIPI